MGRMPTEASLRLKLKKKPKLVVSTSRNSVRTKKDERSFDKDGVYDRENGVKGKLMKRVRFKGIESGEERRAVRTRKDENSFDNNGVYDRENGLKGKLKRRVKFKGMESGEEGRSVRTRKGENSFERNGVHDRENGFKGKLNKRVKFKGMESGEERRAVRTRRDENSFERNGVYDRENGIKGKLKKRVKFKGMESCEEGREGEFAEKRGKLRTLDSRGRKKRIYAKEEMVENGKLLNSVGASKKKTLLKKGEKQVKDELVEGKICDHRTMWVPGKSGNAGTEAKHSTHKMKDKKENVVLATAKPKAKAKEGSRMEFDKTDDRGNGLLKKNRDAMSEFSKLKSQKVVSPSGSTKKKDRDKAGLDDDAEILDDKPKKKKRVIKIDPCDISNKRLDDGIGINGSKEEKKKESEKEPEMSKNAQFRAIQPSPSILSFVEKNLLGRRRLIDLRRAGYNTELSAPLDNVPSSNGSERERIEETVFRNKLEFFAAAKVSSSFPPPNLPEIAFAGRSNVGKSSLLNALTRQWGVVRTSDKPGLTQTINFFKLGTKLSLVDLPGYGFAYAKEEVKEAWEELVKEYVSTRVGLRRVCLLIDTKWGMKPRDQELIELMERSKTKYQIVLTKTDVVFPIDVARRAMQIEESLLGNKSIVQPLMMVSSKSGAGIRSLRTVLANIARFAKI